MGPLRNIRHERFAQLLAEGQTQVEAYVAAGYKRGKKVDCTANKLARRSDIQARVTRLLQGKAEAAAKSVTRAVELSGIDRAYVLTTLKAVVDRCMLAEPVLDSTGQPIGEYTFNPVGANRALELIGKEIGMFIDRRIVAELPLGELSDHQMVKPQRSGRRQPAGRKTRQLVTSSKNKERTLVSEDAPT